MSRRSGDLASEVSRYLARCVRQGDCLVLPDGPRYGTLRYDSGRQMSAHRASFIVHNGEIPDGLVVRHNCDNPPCVEPSHLLIGTYADNERDKAERGRAPVGQAHYKATLGSASVAEAVREYLTGGQSQAAVARKYGVGQSTLGRWVRAEGRRDAGHEGVVVGKGSRSLVGVKPCGTRAAYCAHKRRKEPACPPCMEANRAYMIAYKAERARTAA